MSKKAKAQLKVYIFDETGFWDKSVLGGVKGARVMVACVVDESVGHYLCEMTPSKHGTFIENFLILPSDTPDDIAEQVRDKFDNDGHSSEGEDFYFKSETYEIRNCFVSDEYQEELDSLDLDNEEDNNRYFRILEEIAGECRANGY